MSGVIPLPPEHFHVGKLVLEAKQYAAAFHSGASFTSISPRPHQLSELGPFLQMGRTLYEVNFEQSKQEK